MNRRAAYFLFAWTVASTLLIPALADARGRGKPSPFVMTPAGPIPKSVYYQDVIANPATLQKMRQQEQQYYDRMSGNKKSGAPNVAGTKGATSKPIPVKKK